MPRAIVHCPQIRLNVFHTYFIVIPQISMTARVLAACVLFSFRDMPVGESLQTPEASPVLCCSNSSGAPSVGRRCQWYALLTSHTRTNKQTDSVARRLLNGQLWYQSTGALLPVCTTSVSEYLLGFQKWKSSSTTLHITTRAQ